MPITYWKFGLFSSINIGMIRTILFLFYLIFIFLTSLLTVPVYWVLRLFRVEKVAGNYINILSSWMGRSLIKGAGGKVEVIGKENLPNSSVTAICVISNHQSFFDIPLLIWQLPFTAGFVAKRSLGNVPLLNLWIHALRCVLINRKSAKSSIQAIEKGVNSIKKGHPMLIFPEGTRSKGGTLGAFKKGSLKLATRSNACIIPVTIDGVYKLYEETLRIRPAQLRMQIHPPVFTENLSFQEKENLSETLRAIICAGIGQANPVLPH